MKFWNEPITDWTLVRVTPRMRAYTIQEIADEAKNVEPKTVRAAMYELLRRN